MAQAFRIRKALEADAASLLEIYRPYVEGTAVSFEDVVPTIEDFAARIAAALKERQWLIAELAGRRIGYAYGSAHRARAAYRWSVEVSAYVDAQHHQLGVGRALYEGLFADLARGGYCNAYAGVTLPNEPSVAFHRRMGFDPIGTFPRVGRKFGVWHDVAWFHRPLRADPPPD